MQLMFVVSCGDAAGQFASLIGACRRRGVEWGCFFTGDGVRLAGLPEMRAMLGCAAKAVVCEHSWSRHMGEAQCPVELGSQTDHSAMIAEADKVVSL